jgi:hypothetical protein
LLELLTYQQFQEWRDAYDANPWGEWRSDARQIVLIDHLLEPWRKHRSSQQPKLLWPYIDPFDGESPAVLWAYMQLFDAALRPKPGGGYELTVPMEEILRQVHEQFAVAS